MNLADLDDEYDYQGTYNYLTHSLVYPRITRLLGV